MGARNVPWYKRSETLGLGLYPGPPMPFMAENIGAAGLGYLWKLGDHSRKAVLLSAGYTVKKLSEIETVANSCMLLDW